MFRQNQKRIATFVIIVVVGTSILSGILGGYLRLSKGDLHWVTVTQAGVGGLVQVGALDLQSAGGRESRVAIQGEHCDLQSIGKASYSYYWARQTGYSPFTWQPNLEPGDEKIYQINVPMSPWGRRRCHATAFRREFQRIELDLQFKPGNTISEGTQKETTMMPAGMFSVSLENRLPFDLKDCWLVVGITQVHMPNANQSNQTGYTGDRHSSLQDSTPIDGLIDVYHVQRLQNLAAGATNKVEFAANFQGAQYQWEMRLWPNGSQIPPRISRMGTANAWIIGRIENSPIIAIDEQRSDFIPQQSVHHFIQEFTDEMPDALQFSQTAKD